MAHLHAGESLNTPTLRIRWWSPVAGIFCSEVSGHFDLQGVPVLLRGFQESLRVGQRSITAFHDWHGITGYSSDARVQYTRGSEPIMKDVTLVNILVGSRLVAMGISVANVVLGGKLAATSDRSVFETALAKAVGA